jgi:hypothetical protein
VRVRVYRAKERKKNKKRNLMKKKKKRKKTQKPVRASRLWVQLCCTYCTKRLIITLLKVLVLSLYNSVLNICALAKKIASDVIVVFRQITKKWTNVSAIVFCILSSIVSHFHRHIGYYKFNTHVIMISLFREIIWIAQC